jgi:SAM-dependent methyltransferase
MLRKDTEMSKSEKKSLLVRAWKAVLPEFVRGSSVIYRLKKRLIGHNYVYSSEYFKRDVEDAAVSSAPHISSSIARDYRPQSVIDVGCGTGALLEAIAKHGIEVYGLEYADAAIEFCHRRKLNVQKFDLERSPVDIPRKFSVAVSMEVAEHLPASVSDRYVHLLTSLAPVVVFTAAVPGQGGLDHVNEQPPEYWIAKFAAHGHELIPEVMERWKSEWRGGGKVAGWYHGNLLVFQSAGYRPIGSK